MKLFHDRCASLYSCCRIFRSYRHIVAADSLSQQFFCVFKSIVPACFCAGMLFQQLSTFFLLSQSVIPALTKVCTMQSQMCREGDSLSVHNNHNAIVALHHSVESTNLKLVFKKKSEAEQEPSRQPLGPRIIKCCCTDGY